MSQSPTRVSVTNTMISNRIYVLAVTDDQKVVDCAIAAGIGADHARADIPAIVGVGFPQSASMIESSRFCVDVIGCRKGRGQLHLATLTLFAGIIEWSMANCYDEIVTATDLCFERILNRAEWPMKRLGDPLAIGNTKAVAGTLPADQLSLIEFANTATAPPPPSRSTAGRSGAQRDTASLPSPPCPQLQDAFGDELSVALADATVIESMHPDGRLFME